jgi:hypothetical protein
MKLPIVIAMVGTIASCACASAAAMPVFNYERTCKETPTVGMDADRTIRSCMASEESARESLARIWDRAKPSSQKDCRTLTEMGGVPSYVELITCIEMRQGDLQEKPAEPNGRAPVAPPAHERPISPDAAE